MRRLLRRLVALCLLLPASATSTAAQAQAWRPTAPLCTSAGLSLAAFPAGGRLSYSMAITTTADFAYRNVFFSGTSGLPSEMQADGWLGSCIERVLYARRGGPTGSFHVVKIETDFFSSTVGARTAYAYLADQSRPVHIDAVNPLGPSSLAYSDNWARPTPPGAQAYTLMLLGSTLTTSYAFSTTVLATTAALKATRHQMRQESSAVAPLLRGHLVHLRAIGLVPLAHMAPTAYVGGTQTAWHVTLDRVVRARTIGDQTAQQGTYVVVILRVTNTGLAPASFSTDVSTALQDDVGRTYSENSAVEIAATAQYNLDNAFDDIQPTFTAHIVLGFNIPTVAVALHLLGEAAADGGGAAQQLLPLGY